MSAANDAGPSAESEAWVAVTDGLPEDGRSAIAWDVDSQMPCVTFYDLDSSCWYAQADGTAFDDGAVTHWRHYVGPDGETSGEDA